MGSDIFQKFSNYDEMFMQHSLQFEESIKDLKNLRKQLYTAAEYFESSYDRDDEQQVVIDSSKEYVANAVVSTVDHLGSVADKLNKFLDEKTDQFSATHTRFSCIQQRLSSFQGFIDMKGTSQHSLLVEAPKHHKHYIHPVAESFRNGNSKVIYRNCIKYSQHQIHQYKQDNPFAKAFQATRIDPHPSLLRKGQPGVASNESSPSPLNFSFLRVMSRKEIGKRSVSPLGFAFKRSGSVTNRSLSPSPSDKKQRWSSEPGRAIVSNRDREIGESYTKRSKHLFKALLNRHRSRK